jgi:hypothetical protein
MQVGGDLMRKGKLAKKKFTITEITIQVLCLLTVLIFALILPSFASDDLEKNQLNVFRDRFKDLRIEGDKLWLRMDSTEPDNYAAIRLLMEESHALSGRMLEFGYEVRSYDLTRQEVYKKRFADSDAFLFLASAASEMCNLLSSRTDFMRHRRAIFLTAANKHQEIVEMFVKASQDVTKVLNK